MSIHDDIQYIERAEEHRNALLVKAATLKRDIYEKLKKVRKAFAAGESTGDHIRDMVLTVHGLDHKLEEKYRELEGKLKGKRGEFVLLSYHAKIPFKHSMTGVEYRDASCFRLGVLEGEELVWKDGDGLSAMVSPVTFHISRYIKSEEGYIRPGDNLGGVVQKNIFARGYDEGPPPLHALMRSEGGEIVIGDEAVKKWLEERGIVMEALFVPAAAALSKLILEPTTEED
ncbi:hypothetical protein HYS79_01085 [Patescibacteria group bacterium]|nr:hypothetical protein [Patescibacteria group bacterium]